MQTNTQYRGAAVLRALTASTLMGALSLPAQATQATFPHGYGAKAEGMGGVGIALPQDAVAGATNPAGMVHVGTRIDLGVAFLKADNGAVFAGQRYSGSEDTNLYIIPQLGANWMIDPVSSIGVSVVGNGVGTNYDDDANVGGMVGPRSKLEQAVMTISYSRKLNDVHSVGIGLVLSRQLLTVDGTDSLGLPTGRDESWGAGLRVGWQGQVLPGLTLGATYASRVDMSEFNELAGLLPEHGDLDIPANYGFGVAYTTGAWTLGMDVMRVLWSDIAAYGNGGVTTASGAPGSDDGPGFGWHDQTVWRFGAAYAIDDRWTVRAGYNHGTHLLDGDHTYLGIIAPSANRRHVTVGASYVLGNGNELTVSYARSFKETTKGTGAGPDGMTDLYMGQDWLSLSYGLRF